MSNEHIIRAWKDAEYRMSLSEEERAQLPENPAGLIELTDAEMGFIGGGYDNNTVTVNGQVCCSSGDMCRAPDDPPTPGTNSTITVNSDICCSSGCGCM
ncbi:MAG TPA: mersacidin/lichenicidin family type 2 lantibiotic [Coleofasciculaceae cyanobacterium]|jgi:mersacidin/lichenicidin family type 2 lantibiotic